MIMKTGCRGCFCHFNPNVSVHSGHRVPHRQWRCRWVSSLSLILRLRPFLHHYGTDRAHGHTKKKERKYHRHGMATRPPKGISIKNRRAKQKWCSNLQGEPTAGSGRAKRTGMFLKYQHSLSVCLSVVFRYFESRLFLHSPLWLLRDAVYNKYFINKLVNFVVHQSFVGRSGFFIYTQL